MKKLNLVALFIMILVIGFFYAQILRYGVNIPFSDDVNVLQFVSNFFATANTGERIALLFAPIGIHKLVFTKVIFILTRLVTGGINFKTLMFIGGLGVSGLFIVLCGLLPKSKNSILYCLPIIFLLFQFQYHQAIFWGMASIQNLYAPFFAFLCLYLLTKKEFSFFVFSLLIFLVSVFTSGNGMLLLFIGTVYLITTNQYKKSVVWTILGASFTTIFFLNFPHYAHPIRFDPFYYLCFLSSSVVFFKTPLIIKMFIVELFGLSAMVYLYWIIKSKYYSKNPTIFLCLMFLLGTGILVSTVRTFLGIPYAFSSRYTINSVLIIILFYISAMETLLPKAVKVFFPAFLALSVLFNVASYYQAKPEFIAHNHTLIRMFPHIYQ